MKTSKLERKAFDLAALAVESTKEIRRLRAALDEIREHLGQLRPCDYKTKEAAERMERAWAAVVKATEE